MILMRKPGRVLFSLRVIRSIAAPSTLSAIARAKHRHAIRGAITSAIDDMLYIHGNADDKTKEHLLVEIERLITVMYMEPGKTIRLVPIQGLVRNSDLPCPHLSSHALIGGDSGSGGR